MTHEDGFLQTNIDNPDDDTPRLVYADWLDEHGDPARAEFIRVQCELAKLPDHDPRVRALEDREHELLGANEGEWFPDATGLHEWEWSRGFVDDVTADHQQLTSGGAGAWTMHPVTRIRAISGDLISLAYAQFWVGSPWNQTIQSLAILDRNLGVGLLDHFL